MRDQENKFQKILPYLVAVAGVWLIFKTVSVYQEVGALRGVQRDLIMGALTETENTLGRLVLYRRVVDASVQFSKWSTPGFAPAMPVVSHKKLLEPQIHFLLKKVDSSFASLKDLIEHQNLLLSDLDFKFHRNLKESITQGNLTHAGELYLSWRELEASLERSIENLQREQHLTLKMSQAWADAMTRNLFIAWAFYFLILAFFFTSRLATLKKEAEQAAKSSLLEVSHFKTTMQELQRTSSGEQELFQKRLDDLTQLTSLSDQILNTLDLALIMFAFEDSQLKILRTNNAFWRVFEREDADELADAKTLFLRTLGLDIEAMLAQAENVQLHQIKGVGVLAGRAFDLNLQILSSRDSKQGLIILSDVTHRVELEERLGVAEKLSFMGKLASQMAHEIRNPLNALSLQLEMLEVAKADLPRLELIHREIDRLNRTCDEYLNVSRDSSQRMKEDWSAKRKVAFPKILEHCLGLMSLQLMGHGIEIDLQVSPAMEDVTLPLEVARALQQIILNLVKNSMEAFTLDADDAAHVGGSTPPQRTIRIEAARSAQNFLIQVSDNGPGVPQELRGQIFTPFVTSKAKGYGLGLAVARELCRKFGGDLSLSEGTRVQSSFELTLPLQFFKMQNPKSLGDRFHEKFDAAGTRAS